MERDRALIQSRDALDKRRALFALGDILLWFWTSLKMFPILFTHGYCHRA